MNKWPVTLVERAQAAIDFIVRHLRSLSTRVTVFTLALFVLSIWSLALHTSRMLRDDMQVLVGAQQFSTVSVLAAHVNQAVQDRFGALDAVAGNIDSAMLADPKALQALLAQRPFATGFFNAGVVVYGLDGTALAELPMSAARVGINYMDIDTVAQALKEGKSTVSRPVVGKKLKVPVFGMTVPIRDAQGQVIGALSGVIDLSQTNFLDQIGANPYGKTGGFLIVDTKHRLIVTATDKIRIMEVLPAPGASPTLDRFIRGYEGTEVFVNPLGVNVLVSVKAIPLAGWYMAVILPTSELHAPMAHMQESILTAATVLTLLAGVASWWMLRRQLSPLLSAVKTLTALATSDQPPKPLAIARHDEIGDLIGSFNHLLGKLGQREAALRESFHTLQRILDTTLDGFWRVDMHGRLFAVNPTYCQQSLYSEEELLGIHISELDAWETPQETRDHIQSIMTLGRHQFETRHRRKDGTTWEVEVSATFPQVDKGQFFVFLRDITLRKQAELALKSSLQDKVALLNEVHHRVKNNLQVITSLLRLEAGRTAQADTRAMLGDMQGRLRAMALLHESLYRTGIFASVELGGYLRALTTQAFRAQANPSSAIRLVVDVMQVQVSMDLATPCGLLVNELIANSLKHGFPDGHSGEVLLQLQPVPGCPELRLCVSDTGVGLPHDFELRRTQSLGLQLVSDLVRQIVGVLEIGPGPGAAFAVTFMPEEQKHQSRSA
jgi:PAS domain S-box-containing protein